jgi:hypothetical protein
MQSVVHVALERRTDILRPEVLYVHRDKWIVMMKLHPAHRRDRRKLREALRSRDQSVLLSRRAITDGLTALELSCTARAFVSTRSGAAAAAHPGRGRQRVICSRRDTALVLFGRGGSAAGPKPGRDNFSA